MSQTYSPAHDLHELAARSANEAAVAVAGDLVGVALPDWSSIQPCAILLPDAARKLGAQLLLAADELDAIQGAAFGLPDSGGFGLTRENAGVKIGDRAAGSAEERALLVAELRDTLLTGLSGGMPSGPERAALGFSIEALADLALGDLVR